MVRAVTVQHHKSPSINAKQLNPGFPAPPRAPNQTGTSADASGVPKHRSPLESVPIWGIAAIAGVTAWEIHDGCSNLDDLHNLIL